MSAGVRTLRHQDTSAPRQFGTKQLMPKCPDTSAPNFFWCRTVSRSFRTGAELSWCRSVLIDAKCKKDIERCSDVTIIESEIEIEFFIENRIESKSIFWLVFVIDFDSPLYWRRQRTAASSENDSYSHGVLNTPT